MTFGLAAPFSAVASDGGGVSQEFRESGKLAHPRAFGTFTHFLHRFVRDKGLVSWEEGIRKTTSLPADLIGIKNRGKIQKKYHADVVVFNPSTLGDQATYQNPHLVSKGVEWVLVNGRIALAGGKLTNTAGGQVLRK
ncbi:MAG: amidohydrolase family protein [Candidatus Sungbacteria bacterium]|nr:amidohydrolase family protein [Candidatus Sungbacteria bacterium]